ncbi:hypothetical protein M378DRAFT_28703 [Amanita muscaria Koide BX008]|uniref:Uncharacterized protein n=1 Tax=Amanita muscaria (strain Koide BX008) TaxID=946122 RepID=A0A0C2RWE3_AMAMK|nr:hypothetical protein M378DRAFT_28703 [Amanita muscaria Koide BX008]
MSALSTPMKSTLGLAARSIHSQTSAGAAWPHLTRILVLFVYGLQPRAIQGMLDFDCCSRATPSVVFASSSTAARANAIKVKTIASTPEVSRRDVQRRSLESSGKRSPRHLACHCGVMDNIIASELIDPIQLASLEACGMPNELKHPIYHAPEQGSVCKIPASRRRWHRGFKIIDAVKKGIIKKAIVAWAIDTCAKTFTTELHFRHSGSMANSDVKTVHAKNRAMKNAGFAVPDSFEEFWLWQVH